MEPAAKAWGVPVEEVSSANSMETCAKGGDCLYKIAHSWLDPVVNPVQTALGCPLRTEALAYPINGAER